MLFCYLNLNLHVIIENRLSYKYICGGGHMTRRKIPYGISDFEKIKREQYVYVDKTSK